MPQRPRPSMFGESAGWKPSVRWIVCPCPIIFYRGNGPRTSLRESGDGRYRQAMCNLYRNDIRKAGREREYYGYEEFSETPLEIYPDMLAPVIGLRKDGSKGWTSMRWGFPPPENLGKRPVTNIRNLNSSYWRGWLEPRYRCLVPF